MSVILLNMECFCCVEVEEDDGDLHKQINRIRLSHTFIWLFIITLLFFLFCCAGLAHIYIYFFYYFFNVTRSKMSTEIQLIFIQFFFVHIFSMLICKTMSNKYFDDFFFALKHCMWVCVAWWKYLEFQFLIANGNCFDRKEGRELYHHLYQSLECWCYCCCNYCNSGNFCKIISLWPNPTQTV